MSINNQHKPGYKHTAIGWIPEEWEVKKLGELGKVVSGLTYDPSNISSDGVLVLRSSNIKNRRLAFTDNVYVKVSEGDFNPVQTGDILICVRNGSRNLIGKNALITEEAQGLAFGAFMALFRSESSSFLHQLFDTNLYLKEIHKNLGATINSINGSDLRVFKIPYPPDREREKIAAILATWDEAITKTQQLTAQLQQRNKGLMQQLLTGKKRLKGFEHEEWKKSHANEIFKSVSVKNKPGEQLLSATQDKGIIPRNMLEARVTMPAGETASFKLVEKGDFVISLRSFQGGIEYSEYRGLVSPAYTVLKPARQINNSYYKHYFKSYDFIGHLAVAVIGIRDGKQVSYEDFSFLKLPYPSVQEQKAIAKVLDAAVNEVKLYEQRLAALQQQKKGLMQKLLTGEVRVKIDHNKNS